RLRVSRDALGHTAVSWLFSPSRSCGAEGHAAVSAAWSLVFVGVPETKRPVRCRFRFHVLDARPAPEVAFGIAAPVSGPVLESPDASKDRSADEGRGRAWHSGDRRRARRVGKC